MKLDSSLVQAVRASYEGYFFVVAGEESGKPVLPMSCLFNEGSLDTLRLHMSKSSLFLLSLEEEGPLGPLSVLSRCYFDERDKVIFHGIISTFQSLIVEEPENNQRMKCRLPIG
jgi:hypothetical protein